MSILDTINAELNGDEESITVNNARLDAIFEGPDAGGPQVHLLRLTAAYLSHLTVTDLETWDEDDRDDTDGLLREIIRLGAEARPALVAGIPDPPAGAETWARADQLTEDVPEPARKAIRMLAATVQAFEDAGLTDGSHFLNMAAHVWGFSARDIHDPAGPTSTVVYDGVDTAKLGLPST